MSASDFLETFRNLRLWYRKLPKSKTSKIHFYYVKNSVKNLTKYKALLYLKNRWKYRKTLKFSA